MSFVGSGTTGSEQAQKFIESLQTDFRNLSAETKKKNPQIKEVSESNCYAGDVIVASRHRQQNISHAFTLHHDSNKNLQSTRLAVNQLYIVGADSCVCCSHPTREISPLRWR